MTKQQEVAAKRAAEEYYEYKEGMAFIKESFLAGAEWAFKQVESKKRKK